MAKAKIEPMIGSQSMLHWYAASALNGLIQKGLAPQAAATKAFKYANAMVLESNRILRERIAAAKKT